MYVLIIGNYQPDTLSCFGGHVLYFVVWLSQVHGASRHILQAYGPTFSLPCTSHNCSL